MVLTPIIGFQGITTSVFNFDYLVMNSSRQIATIGDNNQRYSKILYAELRD